MKMSKQKFYIIQKGNLYLLDTEHYYKFASKGKPHLFARISDAKRRLESLNSESLKMTTIREVIINFKEE